MDNRRYSQTNGQYSYRRQLPLASMQQFDGEDLSKIKIIRFRGPKADPVEIDEAMDLHANARKATFPIERNCAVKGR